MARKSKPPPTKRSFCVEVDGTIHHGTYEVSGRMIAVRGASGWHETTQLGGHSQHPGTLARSCWHRQFDMGNRLSERNSQSTD